MSAQGYAGTAAGPRALERQEDAVRDQPVHYVPARGGSRRADAKDIPGYYYTTNTAADTAMSYRAAAANGGSLDANEAASLGLTAGFADPTARKLLENMKVELTPADIEWFEERRRTQEQIEFDDWLTTVVNVSDPGENRWLQQIYPEWWTRKEKYIDDKINIEARLAKIRLRGVKDINDAKLLFFMEKGYVSPATMPLWSGTPAGGNQFRKGWLSIARDTRTGTPEFSRSGFATAPGGVFPAAPPLRVGTAGIGRTTPGAAGPP